MTWLRVSPEEMKRIRKLAAEKKAKRQEKAQTLWKPIEPASSMLPAIFRAAKKNIRKKSPRELQIKKNDDLWSAAIRKRDAFRYGPICLLCGKVRPLVGYHNIPKKRGMAIRWLLENGVASCSPCNGAERWNPSLYREKICALVGENMVKAIEFRAHTTANFSMDDLLAIGNWLKSVKETRPGNPTPAPPSCLPPISF